MGPENPGDAAAAENAIAARWFKKGLAEAKNISLAPTAENLPYYALRAIVSPIYCALLD